MRYSFSEIWAFPEMGKRSTGFLKKCAAERLCWSAITTAILQIPYSGRSCLSGSHRIWKQKTTGAEWCCAISQSCFTMASIAGIRMDSRKPICCTVMSTTDRMSLRSWSTRIICGSISGKIVLPEIWKQFHARWSTASVCFQITFPLRWMSGFRQIKRGKDRSACHNSLIVKFNQLALKMQWTNAAWREVLKYEEDRSYSRKRIGDFT